MRLLYKQLDHVGLLTLFKQLCIRVLDKGPNDRIRYALVQIREEEAGDEVSPVLLDQLSHLEVLSDYFLRVC